ncbi:MAG: CdaR family protein [Armatimonadota bacterium]|nr:CdaR family protein [Armatimonadota bacterium]
MIRHNLKYKLVALACALLLHAMYGRAAEEPLTLAAVRAPVRAVNVPEGLAPTLMPPLTIWLQGRKSAIDRLLDRPDGGASLVDVSVDLSGQQAGTRTLPVKVTVKGVGPGTEAIKPPPVTVTLEPVITREFTVEVTPRGSVATGYRWESTSVRPKTASVRGPRSLVDTVARLEARVPVNRAVRDVESTVPIEAKDSRDELVEQVEIEPTHAQVYVRVARVMQYRVLPVVVSHIGQPALGFRIARMVVQPLTVTVSGTGAALEQLSSIQTEPIDLTDVQEPITRQVRLRPPPGVEVVGSTTVQVKVFLESEGAAE